MMRAAELLESAMYKIVVGLFAGAQDDQGLGGLAPFFIRHADDGYIDHLGMDE